MQVAEATDIDQVRKWCRSTPSDLHELLAERCRQDQENTERTARKECEAGLGLESGG